MGAIGNSAAPANRASAEEQKALAAAPSGPQFGDMGVQVTSVGGRTTDQGQSSTAPKFGEVWNNIQAKYGARPEKPREIKKALDKDDFLRIMVTQMKHQDPLEPFKAEKFAAELAQFTSVEQLQNLNNNIVKMTKQNQPMEKMAMTNLIGKSIQIDKERFGHTEKTQENLGFQLTKDASKVKVTVISEAGEPVFEKELGETKAGDQGFVWDGLKRDGGLAKDGSYLFRVSATDEHGVPIPISTKSQAQVIGVSFEGAEAQLLVGDPTKPEKVSFKNVSRIDVGVPGGQAAQGQTQAAPPSMIPGAMALSQATQPKSNSAAVPVASMPGAMAAQGGQPQTRGLPPGLTPAMIQQAMQSVGGSGANSRQNQMTGSNLQATNNQKSSVNLNDLGNGGKKSAMSVETEAKGFPNGLSKGGE